MVQPKIYLQDGCLVLELPEGHVSVPENQPAILARLVEAAEDANCFNVMVVGKNVRVRLTVTDLFHLGERVAQTKLKIAMVVTHDAAEDDVQFFRAATKVRDGKLEFFDSVEQAKKWFEKT